MNVSANLLEYLKRNDRAELISIGTFRVEYTPASISPITNTLTPPSRIIVFSNDINNDLGFVQDLSKKEFISVETSLKWIKQYSDSIKERIEKSNSCKLGEIGVLSKGLGKGYVFTPTQGLNLLDSSFAFSTIKSVQTFDQEDNISPIITKEPLADLPIVEDKKIEKKPLESVFIPTSFSERELSQEKPAPKSEVEPLDYKEEILDIEQGEAKDIVFLQREEIKRDAIEMEDAQDEVQSRLEAMKEGKEDELGENEGMDVNDSDSFNYRNTKKFRKNVKKRNKSEKKELKARRKRNRRIWLILSILVLIALLASGFLVLAHYMCWTKNIKELSPLTEKLNIYITPKCEKAEQVIPIAVQTPTTESVETLTTETITDEISKIESTQTTKEEPKKPKQPKKEVIAKEKPLMPTGEKDNPPAPTAQIDYSRPVVMQPVSRLGFDVVGGTFENLANAQQSARKARSLGYDSYIVSKSQDEKTRYYVSYGSRRTMREANSFMSDIIKKHGSAGYYIISR
ncbi:MAG: SPOR domain-containing protein [Bacteroidales bacterium]|nr:SPOR domain-containing protein [Bacteroidales bacterium]